MGTFDQIKKDIMDAMKAGRESGTSAYDTEAEVIRTSGSIAWVHIPGGVDETPVKMTIHSEPGDKVQVRVSGGSAWLVGNETAPPTDDTTAIEAKLKSLEADLNAKKAMKSAEDAALLAQKNAARMAEAVIAINSDIENLQDQIDGNITTWYYAYAPTLSNEPASTWTTTEEKNNHIGDIFYNSETGYSYRFMLNGSSYEWVRISDEDISAALEAASAAQDTADHKRRVFIARPTVPYDKGDLWCVGASGDILTCTKAKTSSQSYAASDWSKLNKYTDDTVANAAAQAAASAQQSADSAAEAAQTAWNHADEANTAAQAAASAAESAQSSADSALQSASTANTAANSALTQLSVVEDVVDVLNWVSEHGSYKLTADTTVVEGKYYFTRSGTSPNYTYTVVTNPTGNPKTKGYYELDSVDEAVSNYVSSHLALTSQGLWVVNDNSSYKILLASDGMKVYDASGNLVSTFGESITFSSTRPQTIGNSSSYVKFYKDGSTWKIAISADAISLGSNAVATQSYADGKASTAETNAKNDTTNKLKSYYTKTQTDSAITQKANEITSTVSSTYATKESVPTKTSDLTNDSDFATESYADGKANTAEANAKADTANKLESYYTKTQTDSAITQKANEIAVSVTETRISELEVGSANLLVDTNAPSLAKVAGEGNRYWSNEVSLPEDGTAEFFEVTDPPVNGIDYGIRLTATVARDTERLRGIAFYRQGIARLKFVEGQPYTMSCYARLSPESTNTNRFSLGLEAGNTWTDKSHVYFTPTTEWKKYSRTFVPNTTTSEGKVVYFQMAYLNIGGIDMCGFKMEKGTFATDWTPAIIDTENYADRAVSTAKAEIKVTTDAISTEVSKKVGSSEIISKINQSAEAIQIQASKVEIDGTTTFNAIKTLADAAYDANGVAGVVQENLDNMGLSGKNLLTGTNTVTALTSTGTNANRTWRKAGDGTGTITHIDVTDAPYAILTNGWQFDITSVNGAAYANSLAIAQNAVNVVAGKTYTMSCYAKGTGKLYMFVGISTFIPSDESGKIASLTNDWKRYSITFTAPSNTAVVNANGTNAFFGANGTNVSLSICGMMLEEGDTATLWSPAPGDLAFEEQRIYYRSSVSTKPNGNGLPTTWVTKNTNKWNSVATNADGWSKKVTPISDGKASGVTKYLYLFTCTQSRSISGEVTYSEILLDDSTTVIDGGNIITGTVTANQIAANAITADKIQGQSLSIGLFDDTTKNSILNDNLGTGLGIKWNASTFDGAWNPGEAYFCKYDSSTGLYTDENGWVMFNGIKRTVAKGMQINPNKVIPFNTRTYKVLRLSSASATTGTQYYVWYNGGWKSSTPATPTVANIADWTWNVNTDIVLCSYVETANEAALVEYEQYTPVRTAHQVTIGNTAYQQAESAAKTASNYIVADSTGLMVAKLDGSGETPSTATTNNVLIDSDSVDIRNGQTTLASFSANKIELGKGNINASIEFCEGHGGINYIPDSNDDSGDVDIHSDDRLILSGANDVLLEGWGGRIGVSAGPPIMYPERQEGCLFICFEDIEIYNKDETIFNTYTTADVTNAIPVTLYNKENAAANESVTLSETAANFKRLTIFFKDTDNNYSSVDVWSPNGKRVSLSLTWINGASTQEMYQRVRWVTISGTTISTYRASASEKYRTGQVKLGATASVTNSDYIAIVHVVGYR